MKYQNWEEVWEFVNMQFVAAMKLYLLQIFDDDGYLYVVQLMQYVLYHHHFGTTISTHTRIYWRDVRGKDKIIAKKGPDVNP